MRATTQDLCHISGGRLLAGGHRSLGPVSIDSRTLSAGATFFCIRGPRFDGHAFAAPAVTAGARIVVVSRARALTVRDQVGLDATVIGVPDTVEALAALAGLARTRFRGRLIGVTGSSGKTTTKELIAAVLERAGSTLKTAGNQNNHLGVPLTLLRLNARHRFAVVEMGMSAPGEILRLASLSRPTIGVITSVGSAHLGGLGGLEQVAAAKGELFETLPPRGVAILPSGVEFPWLLTRGLRAPLVLVGERPVDQVRLVSARETPDGPVGRVEIAGHRHALRLRLMGIHNLHNALLAVAVGLEVGVPPDVAVAALAEVEPPALRGESRALADGARVVLDCYNANPQSMRAALASFARVAPSGLLILGDMLELGDESEGEHRALGREVAGLPGMRLLGVGPLSASLVDAARAAGLPADRAVAVADAEAAGEMAARLRAPGEWVLVKGSRGIGLERVWPGLVGPAAKEA